MTSAVQVVYQHGNTNSLSYPAVIVAQSADIVDLIVEHPTGPIAVYGAHLVSRSLDAGPHCCWPTGE